MVEALLTYGTAILGIAALMIIWVGVQAGWRKVFKDYITDNDVLADRRSCGNCGCTTACIRKPTESNNHMTIKK